MTPFRFAVPPPAGAFLSLRRIAVAGVSRDAKDFSRGIFRELARRGHDVVPVNPGAAEIEGRRCYRRVADVVPPPEGVLVLTSPGQSAEVVADALASGVRHVWLHRGAGRGTATAAAIAACAAHGVVPVTDLCPFMALPDVAWPHRLHAWCRGRSLRRHVAPAVK